MPFTGLWMRPNWIGETGQHKDISNIYGEYTERKNMEQQQV